MFCRATTPATDVSAVVDFGLVALKYTVYVVPGVRPLRLADVSVSVPVTVVPEVGKIL